MIDRFSVVLDKKVNEDFEAVCKRMGMTKKYAIENLVKSFILESETKQPFFGGMNEAPRKKVTRVRR